MDYNQKIYNKPIEGNAKRCARLDRRNYAKVVLIPKKKTEKKSGIIDQFHWSTAL